jgi:serine/threonine-protein kinase
VLHRDIKPENVMIGSFGEVYVLDWGLAVSVDDAPMSPGLDIPRASEAVQTAGTPSYMAPEMLGGDPPRLSKRTDVYLLGAVLYEILNGEVPHVGERMIQVLHSVARSETTFSVTEPAELVEICKRAMARDPNERIESAEAFRDAISDYLSHRASIALARETEKREDELRERLDRAGDANAGRDGEREEAIAALFAECRFGYHQALASWPGNDRAGEGKRRVLSLMVRHALDEDDARGASRLLRELDAPNEALSRDVERALAEERARRDELERLRGDRDPRVGQRTRVVVSTVLGTIWTVGPVLAEVTGGSYGHGAAALALPPLVLLTVLVIVAWWKRDLVRSTAINRQLTGATAITMIAEAALHSGGAIAGLSPPQTQCIALVLFGVMSAAMGLMAAAPLVIPAVGYLLAFFIAARFPELRAYAQSAANLLLTIVAFIAWSRAANRGSKADSGP